MSESETVYLIAFTVNLRNLLLIVLEDEIDFFLIFSAFESVKIRIVKMSFSKVQFSNYLTIRFGFDRCVCKISFLIKFYCTWWDT